MKKNTKVPTITMRRALTCFLPLAACAHLFGACSTFESVTNSPGVQKATDTTVSALGTAKNETEFGLGVAADKVEGVFQRSSSAAGKQETQTTKSKAGASSASSGPAAAQGN
jgi:hypothetical protein